MAYSPLPPTMEDEEYRNWAELPPDLLLSILIRLGAVDILAGADKVCKSWRSVCKDPSLWRVIDMPNHNLGFGSSMKYRRLGECRQLLKPKLTSMCFQAVDRSQGGLVEINILDLGSDDLLEYIADRSSNLKSLTLTCCSQITDQRFVAAVVKLPLLEYLEMSNCSLSGKSLKVLGQACPNMKTLKVNKCYDDQAFRVKNDDISLAIAETMPGLQHLRLFNNGLSDTGLKSILDNCLNLEHLDIRLCFNVNRSGDIMKRCYERVKVVRPPNNWINGYLCELTRLESSEAAYVCDARTFLDAPDSESHSRG